MLIPSRFRGLPATAVLCCLLLCLTPAAQASRGRRAGYKPGAGFHGKKQPPPTPADHSHPAKTHSHSARR